MHSLSVDVEIFQYIFLIQKENAGKYVTLFLVCKTGENPHVDMLVQLKESGEGIEGYRLPRGC